VGTIAADPERAKVVTSSPRGEGLIDTDVAFVLFQVSVVLCPEATTVGAKVMAMVGGVPAAATVTIAVAEVDLPLESDAVAV